MQRCFGGREGAPEDAQFPSKLQQTAHGIPPRPTFLEMGSRGGGFKTAQVSPPLSLSSLTMAMAWPWPSL